MPGAGWIEGKVRWFDDLKGEGLVRAEDGTSYFVHYSNIESAKKRKTLKRNRKVKFQLIHDSHFTHVSIVKEL
jgi:cold shock CspA family protein